MPPLKSWLAFSSGKDSAWALYTARRSRQFDITALLTTITDPFERVSMHAVREELLDRQAEALGLPVVKVRIPSPCDSETYEMEMATAMARAKDAGIQRMVFGDLFLEDVRRYREDKLAGSGIACAFPLWNIPTDQLAREIIGAGVKAIVTCVDPKKIPDDFAGRVYDEAFLDALPAGVDPCAENGEFHTVVVDGPMFSHPVDVRIGDTVTRDGFVFTDVIPL